MTTALVPGLCSVTFRALPVAEVARLAVDHGLATVEWGGDVHVPPGDLAAAERARAVTEDAGLTVASYGSYLVLDHPERVRVGLDDVLATAEALGTTLVRVWCPFGVLPVDVGDGDGEPVDAARARADVVAAARLAAQVAGERGLDLYLEFHGGTLTATADGAVHVLAGAAAPALWCGWQPPYWGPLDDRSEAAAIDALGPRLGHVHVYAWDVAPTGAPIRRPLASEADRWRRRLVAVAEATHPRQTQGPTATPFARAALLEFVADDDPANLAADADTLLAVLADAHAVAGHAGADTDRDPDPSGGTPS